MRSLLFGVLWLVYLLDALQRKTCSFPVKFFSPLPKHFTDSNTIRIFVIFLQNKQIVLQT